MGDDADTEQVWSGSGFVQQTYTLHDADRVVGSLACVNLTCTKAVGENAHGSWLFERDRPLGGAIRVSHVQSSTTVAQFKLKRHGRSWTGSDDLFHTIEGTWGACDLRTDSRELLIEYRAVRPGDLGHQDWTMQVHDSESILRDTPWLDLLGWYVIVVMGWNRPEPTG